MIKYIRTTPPARRVQQDYRTSYANRRWREQSAAFLQQYPFCVWCLFSGKINEGVSLHALAGQRNLIVDHIRPHRGNDQLFWDPDNWQTLCKRPCHDQVKQNSERQGANWWELLHGTAISSGAFEHVLQHRDWIPAGLATLVDAIAYVTSPSSLIHAAAQ